MVPVKFVADSDDVVVNNVLLAGIGVLFIVIPARLFMVPEAALSAIPVVPT